MRRLIAGLVGVAVYFFCYWMGAALFNVVLPIEPAAIAATVVAALAGLAAYRFVARRVPADEGGLGRAMIQGAAIVGAIGFIGGFFGPILFAPEANQGPLLGLFITGPGGAVVGAIVGAIRWLVKRKSGTAPS